MIYLDNAATTSLHPEVLSKMMPYLDNLFGNPSSIHEAGRVAKQGIDRARQELSAWLKCNKTEIVFTSGGTESDYSALFGAMLASEKRHVVTSGIEHHAVLNTLEFLRNFGVSVTMVHPNETGVVQPDDVLSAIRDDTFLVSIMAVNNEIGSKQAVMEIAKSVKDRDPNILFHSDMVQALGTMPIDLRNSAIDLASFSAHKIHGPKGAGALYVRQGTPWRKVLYGGSQERKRRAGTENTAGIVGFGSAVSILASRFEERIASLEKVNHAFCEAISDIEGLTFISPADAVPTIVNIAIDGIRHDTLLMRLDLAGIAASAGSACTAGSLEQSHVLKACGYHESVLQEAIRFSFSEDTSVEDVMVAAQTLSQIVLSMRH